MTTPLTSWQRLRAGNERFFTPVHGHRGGLVTEQPTAVVFRCADAGVASETVFGQSWGSLIDVSTWGHVVDFGVIGTLEYAVEALDVPLIVVLGHHDCRAMDTAMRAWNDAVMPEGASRAAVENIFGSLVRRGAQADSLDSVTSAHVVETGLSLIERSALIAHRVNAGKCGIIAATSCADRKITVHATIGPVGEVDETLLECV